MQGKLHDGSNRKRWMISTMAMDEATRKQRASEADQRRKARRRAKKLGLEGPPLQRSMRAKRPHAKTQAEREQYDIDRKKWQIEGSAAWRARHPERRRAVRKASREKCQDAIKIGARLYKERPEIRERHRLRKLERLKTDIQFRLKHNLSARVRNALRRKRLGLNKTAPTITLIGCNIGELVAHLEERFTPDMSWENYGHYWHMDHIIPLSAFDLKQTDQVLIAFHFTNLQPLLAVENIRKGARLDWPSVTVAREQADERRCVAVSAG